MPITFTPIEAVIVKAINQEEFKDFSYQNPDWRCLERGEVPTDDANEGRRALRDDLSVNLKQTLPMTPILSHQSANNETASSTITVVKTDHMPIPHTETKRSASPSPFQLNSTASVSSTTGASAQAKALANNHSHTRSSSSSRASTDQTDM